MAVTLNNNHFFQGPTIPSPNQRPLSYIGLWPLAAKQLPLEEPLEGSDATGSIGHRTIGANLGTVSDAQRTVAQVRAHILPVPAILFPSTLLV